MTLIKSITLAFSSVNRGPKLRQNLFRISTQWSLTEWLADDCWLNELKLVSLLEVAKQVKNPGI